MQKFDIGLVGASMQSALIAGLLARDHNLRVCLIIENSTPYQLSRELNLSFDCIIRPQTIDLLEKTLFESVPIISKIGGTGAMDKVNPVIMCTTEMGKKALSHMYHLLRAKEFEIERLSEKTYANSPSAYRIRGARAVNQGYFWPKLLKWLRIVAVTILDPRDVDLSSRRDGSAQIKANNEVLEIKRMVLSDEQSIKSCLSHKEIQHLFRTCRTTKIVTTPVARKDDPVILNPEHRLGMRQNENGGLEILCDGEAGQLGALIYNIFGEGENFSLAGRATYNSLISLDGAPIIGKLPRSPYWILGGLGNIGVFLAPALARYLAGKSTGVEDAYFNDHSPSAKRKSKIIADFGSSFRLEA